MSGYTQGPWEVEKDQVGAMTNIYDSTGKRLANVYWDHSEAEDHANARLMAAAPVMAAALKWAVDIYQSVKLGAHQKRRWGACLENAIKALRAAGVEV